MLDRIQGAYSNRSESCLIILRDGVDEPAVGVATVGALGEGGGKKSSEVKGKKATTNQTLDIISHPPVFGLHATSCEGSPCHGHGPRVPLKNPVEDLIGVKRHDSGLFKC